MKPRFVGTREQYTVFKTELELQRSAHVPVFWTARRVSSFARFELPPWYVADRMIRQQASRFAVDVAAGGDVLFHSESFASMRENVMDGYIRDEVEYSSFHIVYILNMMEMMMMNRLLTI